VAGILKAVVSRLLQAIGFDGLMERGGIKQFFDRPRKPARPPQPSSGRWFSGSCSSSLLLRTPSESSRSRPVLAQLIAYIPSIIAATTLVYAAFAAITELGIAVQLTAPTFLIVLGAVALAPRDVARDIVEKAYERRDEAKQTVQQQGDSGPGPPQGPTSPPPVPKAEPPSGTKTSLRPAP
jgi:hypothetical protein